MHTTPAQRKILRSANQDGYIYICRQTYKDRSLNGAVLNVALRMVDAGLLTLDAVEFRNTPKCAMKDHTFRITDAGRAALEDAARIRALIQELIDEA